MCQAPPWQGNSETGCFTRVAAVFALPPLQHISASHRSKDIANNQSLVLRTAPVQRGVFGQSVLAHVGFFAAHAQGLA